MRILLLFELLIAIAFSGDVVVNCGLKSSSSDRHSEDFVCKNGWKPFESHCYRLFYTPKSWSQAADFCALQGGHLTSIKDEKENDFLKQLVTTTGQQISHWIGGFTGVHSPDQRWTDGSEWQFSSFPMEMVNATSGNATMTSNRCTVVHVVLATSIEWYNDHCGSEWPFICKKNE
ncbi:hypothetical protein L596_015302 [Steinernema carpocapsae]|uniref:C-type lectin domain-containing protein n=1 Tax=Steinernema carpocapsae TaxID=34508 RepID=A0A4U5NF60_STECR|nr:hypothetical protein L596_015302 [Steinernema carpocapsae]